MTDAVPRGDAGRSGEHDYATSDPPELLPVRMLNEYAYCPRLFHLMHVDGRWADNVFTVEGQAVHRRVDRIDHLLPAALGETDPPPPENAATPSGAPARDPHTSSSARSDGDGDEPPQISRSVPLESVRLGLTATLDLVSTATGDDGVPEAVPVETKRGRVPQNEQRSYEPERVQLMAQGLLLREHGYRCDHGVLYFAGSRTRVDVRFTLDLESRTLELIAQARDAARATLMPPPLEDSPKCIGCSLNGICLPDETNALLHASSATPAANDAGSSGSQSEPGRNGGGDGAEAATSPAGGHIRRLYPARDDALPLYVQEQGATVGKTGESLVIRKAGEVLGRARLKDVSQLVLCGNVGISAQTTHLLCETGIPIVHLSMGHWFYGVTTGITLRNAFDRAAQFAAAREPVRCLALARDLVAAKGANQRTMLRRNGDPPASVLRDMSDLLDRVSHAPDLSSLLGLEGAIAARYFSSFAGMLSGRDFPAEWDFTARNRRPPRDPINALLSFGYALLTKEFTTALIAEGLDPWWGFYHQPRHGRPGLSLDLMEPFRPLIVDSAVITAVNTGMLRAADFTVTPTGCMLKPAGRKQFLQAYESRLDQLVTHPVFDYRCAWRAMIRLHARLFSRWLRGDVPTYQSITTR